MARTFLAIFLSFLAPSAIGSPATDTPSYTLKVFPTQPERAPVKLEILIMGLQVGLEVCAGYLGESEGTSCRWAEHSSERFYFTLREPGEYQAWGVVGRWQRVVRVIVSQ